MNPLYLSARPSRKEGKVFSCPLREKKEKKGLEKKEKILNQQTSGRKLIYFLIKVSPPFSKVQKVLYSPHMAPIIG